LRLKILKKLRTASLNSEFTGSFKKSVSWFVSFTVKLFKEPSYGRDPIVIH